MSAPVLETRDLTIRFGGHVAVDRRQLRLQRRHAHRHRRPERRRQDHLLQPDVRPAAGHPPAAVHLDGEDITRLSAAERARRGIGRAFQITNLFPNLTVGENVRLAVQAQEPAAAPTSGAAGRAARDWIERAEHFLEEVALADKRHVAAAALPHGDKRKLEVALMMALEPHVFMFDEPTAGMSIDEVPVILDLIKKLKAAGDRTILLVEHKMDVVRSLADRIIVLHNGKLVADGDPATVIASPVVQEAYLGAIASASRGRRHERDPAAARRRAHPYRPVPHPAGRRPRGAARRADRAAWAATAPARPRRCAPSWACGSRAAAASRSTAATSAALATPDIALAGIAYVPETMGVFSDLTVAENLRLAARHGAAGCGAARLDFRLLPGAAEVLARSRPACCRAARSRCCRSPAPWSSRARLILVDEPTKGIAPAIIENMIHAFQELKRANTTILLVEQNFRFAAALGDSVAVMDDGRIVHNGTMAELAADTALQTRLLGLSLGQHQ